MGTPIIRDTSILGIMEEVTEGTFLPPASAADYFQPEEDGFDFTPARELLERNILTASIGAATPKLGTKSATGKLSVELRGSGTEGAAPDFDLLLKGALGASRAIATTTTTKSSGNTGSVLAIEDADISKFNVGDIVVVKQSGAYHVSPIVSKTSGTGTATITLLVAKASGNFANSVVVSKTQMYLTGNSGHPALSLSYYWANEIRQAAIGAKVTSMSVDNFTVGQLAKLAFGWDALSFTEVDGAAPHTPTYDAGTPPVILQACLYKDGVDIPINTFGLSLENTLGFKTSTCSANGREASRVVQRAITGTFNPYMDDTSVDEFDNFVEGDLFSLFIRAYNPDPTNGVLLGSVVGIYLPKVMITGFNHGNLDGLMTNEIAFKATRGLDGSTEEMYVGLI